MFLILLAYFMGALPGMEQSQVDIFFVTSFHKLWHLLCNHVANKQEEQKRLIKWASCFERVLLMLADQQLVTSLAITVATFSKWRDISVYSLNMAWTMVTMSLVTHLATIRFFPKYLKENPFLRKGRIVGVALVIIGYNSLQFTTGIASFTAFEHANALTIPNYSPRSVFWKMLPSCLFLQNPSLPPNIGYGIFWSVTLWTYYASTLNKILSQDLHGSTFLYRMLVKRVFLKDLGVFDNFDNLFSSRVKWISKIKSCTLQRMHPVLRGLAAFEAAYFAIKASVSADIPWLLLVLTYSLTKLVTTWLGSDSPFWESATESQGFGFGQTTALFLLAIPLLTFLQESFVESQDQHENTSGHSQLPIAPASCIEGSNSHYNSNNLLKNRIFKISVYALSLWNTVVFVFAAVIIGLPPYINGAWTYDFRWTLSGILFFVSLFFWGTALELSHVVQILCQALLALKVRAVHTVRQNIGLIVSFLTSLS
jgi:hypothetical protein